MFLWLIWHGRILTNDERKRHHMTEDDSCPLCLLDIETILHALRDCTFARNIWRSVIPPQVHNTFFTLSFHAWLTWNMQDKGNLNRNNMEWKTLFFILYWLI